MVAKIDNKKIPLFSIVPHHSPLFPIVPKCSLLFSIVPHCSLKGAPENSVVLLQMSAQNPTGMDPTKEEWTLIADIIEASPISDNTYFLPNSIFNHNSKQLRDHYFQFLINIIIIIMFRNSCVGGQEPWH